MTTSFRLVGIFSVIVVVCGSCLSQDELPTRVTNQNRTGDLPFSTSVGTDVEHVDVASGNLIVKIPITFVKGRGLDFNFFLRYDPHFLVTANRVDMLGRPYQIWKAEQRDGTGGGPFGSRGWELGIARVTHATVKLFCTPDNGNTSYQTFYVYHDANGGKHPLAMQTSGASSCPAYDYTGPDLTGEGVLAVDPGKIIEADGTTYNNGYPWTDTNGNLKGQGPGAADTLGRTIVTQTNGTNQIFHKIYDSNGVLQTYTVNYTTISIGTNFAVNGFWNTRIIECSSTCSGYVITSIVLPNGQSYQFQYESPNYGALTRIDLPNGAYITYTWATLADAQRTHRYVASRTVHVGSQTYTWNFSRTGGDHSITETVTDPLGNQSIYSVNDGAVQSAQLYQGAASGTPLRQYTMTYKYDWDPWNDPSIQSPDYEPQHVGNRLTSIVTTLEDGQTSSRKDFDYEEFTYTYTTCHGDGCPNPPTMNLTTSRGNVTEIREYDYGGSTPVRRTHRDYLHNAPNSPYLTYNIVNRVVAETVYDGGGTQRALTQFEYDTYSPPMIGTSGVPQHDYTNYSSAFLYRGNITKVERWRNTDGATVATSYAYDDLGNIRSIADPLGHTSTWDYTDRWSGTGCLPPANSLAYPTQVTNALNQRLQFTYFPCTGLRQARKDENDIAAGRSGTTNTYDLLGRNTSTVFPDGGQTNKSYNDVPPISVTTTTKITSSVNMVSVALKDGLGRVTQNQLTSDPEGTTYTDTTYDAFGRKNTERNPYRSTSDLTYGVTTYQYDALGRVVKLIPPDGSSASNNVVTYYNLNTTIVTDQAGSTLKSQTDALGRLTAVWEPDGSGSWLYETDYQYDVLGNLTCVEQHGNVTGTGCAADPSNDATSPWRVRRFTYNSLSQLLTTKNPEAGSITYTYNDDGVVTSKQDARGITTTYTPDALHRISKKTYSDATVTVYYNFDGGTQTNCTPSGLSDPNPVGRRTGMCDGSGTTLWGHDPMGRVRSELRTIGSVSKTISYTFNPDGSLAQLVYPSGRTVNYSYSGAARALSAIDSANNNIATSALYAPTGALASVKYGVTGSFTGIVTSNSYNKRLQPVILSATAPSQTVMSLSYDFHVGTADNGNVFQIVNNRDNSRSQSFAYDQLNRVASGQSQATSGANCWGESFGYDAWGNVLNHAATKSDPSCQYEPLSLAATLRNQVQGFCYDLAGDLLGQTNCSDYSYDADARITTAAGVAYSYDGDGKRVKKNSGKLYWTGTGGDPLEESDLSGNVNEEFLFLNGKRIARMDLPSGAIHFYFSDHLGSASVITDAQGATIEQESDYYPYGGERTITVGPNNYKFTGKERDAETGNDFFGARYYASSTARWLSPDWSASPTPVPYAKLPDPQSLNLYSYVRNNPLVQADLDGHQKHERKQGAEPLSFYCKSDSRDDTCVGGDAHPEPDPPPPAQNQANENTRVGNTTEGALEKTMTNEVGSLSTPKKGNPDVLSDAKDALANALINNAQLDSPAKVAPATGTASTQDAQIMKDAVTNRANGGADPVEGRTQFGTTHNAHIQSRSAGNHLKGAAGRETVYEKFGPFRDSVSRRPTWIVIYNDPGQ